MVRNALRLSPRDVDPLSWVARPWVPLCFAIVVLVFGLASSAGSLTKSPVAWLDMVATVLLTSVCLWVQFCVRPIRGEFGPGRASVSIAGSVLALAASTVAARQSPDLVQFWWAPVGLGLVVAAIAAYVPPLLLGVYGGLLTIATGFAAAVAFVDRPDDPWTPSAAVLIACSPIAVGTIGPLVFSLHTVKTAQRLIDEVRASPPTAATDADKDEAAAHAQVATLARLGSRVAPFLNRIAEVGTVNSADRALAGNLARRLRSELVTQANTSWLESLAPVGRVYVVDPDHRADSLNTPQRAALRGLIEEAIKDPSTDSGSIFIELRQHSDGSTAVALSIDLDQPEGKRVMMIAPYYLALKTAVSDISWDAARDLLQFTAPPGRRW